MNQEFIKATTEAMNKGSIEILDAQGMAMTNVLAGAFEDRNPRPECRSHRPHDGFTECLEANEPAAKRWMRGQADYIYAMFTGIEIGAAMCRHAQIEALSLLSICSNAMAERPEGEQTPEESIASLLAHQDKVAEIADMMWERIHLSVDPTLREGLAATMELASADKKERDDA